MRISHSQIGVATKLCDSTVGVFGLSAGGFGNCRKMRKFADDEYLNDDFMKQILTIIIALFMALVAVAQNELVYNESLERLAAGGNAVAQNNLGIVYQQGSGVARDLEKAAYWFQKGAENGSAPAMSNLGVAYLNGQGVERNLPLAVQ